VKRTLIASVLLLVGWFLGAAIYSAMAPEAQRIRWLFEAEAAAFNGASMLWVLDGFAHDYRDSTLGLQRGPLRAALLHAFQSRRQPATGQFRYRVELPAESFAVAIEACPDRATVTTPLLLFDRMAAGAQPVWHLQVKAWLERRSTGWCIVRSEHETLQGARPR